METTGERWRLGHRMLLVATVLLAALSASHAVWLVQHGQVGVDVHAYWLAGRVEHPYAHAPGSIDAFLYSPIFAQVVWPLAQLPWPWFAVAWMIAEAACFWWLVAPARWPWRVMLLLIALPEVLYGNVYGFYGLVLVLGLCRSSLWAVPLFTKIAPIVAGVAWFATRREWRHLVRLALVSAVLLVGSVAISPGLWVEWVRFLLDNAGGGLLWLRLLIAVPVAWFAARTGRAWLLPVAVMVLVPTWFGGIKDLALLAAVPRLWAVSTRHRVETRSVVTSR